MENNISVPGGLDQWQTLVDIIAKLRSPDGCPWDREQTHSSLRRYLLEECYEVLAALDEGDSGKLCDELGDLLLQLVLHAQIAAEAGEFELADVLTGISKKMVHRHPHIFGSEEVSDAGEVVFNWEALKREERGSDSILASVPKEMPALGYSQSIQHRVDQVGFDWPDVDGVIDKLTEEVSEFKEAGNDQEKADEFGDLLFTLVNVARRFGIDPEVALREANQRFYRRFGYMEEVCRQRGLNIGNLSFQEQNQLWEEAKKGLGE